MSMIKSPRIWSVLLLIGSLLLLVAVAYSIFGVRSGSFGFREAASIIRLVVKIGAGIFVLSVLVMILGRKNAAAVKTSLAAALLVGVPVIVIAMNQPAGSGLSGLTAPPGPPAGRGAGRPPAAGGDARAERPPGQGQRAANGGAAGGQPARTPPLNDISTDTKNPPLYNAVASLRADGNNSVEYRGAPAAKIQSQLFPDLAPIKTSLTKPEAFDRAMTVAKKMSWDIVANDVAAGHIEGVATTFFFGYKDDIVIRVTEAATGSVVDIRSQSRVGRRDRGKNAERIREFISRFNG